MKAAKAKFAQWMLSRLVHKKLYRRIQKCRSSILPMSWILLKLGKPSSQIWRKVPNQFRWSWEPRQRPQSSRSVLGMLIMLKSLISIAFVVFCLQQGLKEGLVGMKKASTRLIFVPPKLGYGKNGSKKVPGDSYLIYEVNLIKVKLDVAIHFMRWGESVI